MKYFEKIADLEEWVEDRSKALSEIDSQKIKIIQSISKEKWRKNWKQLKDLVARKYSTLVKSIKGE